MSHDNYNSNEVIDQQQYRQPTELKSNLKKSPPIQQQHKNNSKGSSPQLANDMFNKFDHINEEPEHYHQQLNDLQISTYSESSNNNYPVPQLKKQLSYPTFTSTEPIKKLGSSSSLTAMTSPQQQHIQQQRSEINDSRNYSDSSFGNENTSRQYATRSSNEYFQQRKSTDFNSQQQPQMSSLSSNDSANTNLIPTPKGFMTQQELLNLVLKQDEQLKTLQEQINRLLANNQLNNTSMIDNSKTSDSSSNEQRSISSLKSNLGSEAEFNNSQFSVNNKNTGATISGSGVHHNTSISSNMGTNGAANTEIKSVHPLMANNNNIFNEETTVYRSIERETCESPIMLFDQSVKSNEELHSKIDSINRHQHEQSLVSSQRTKSDESNNSWKSNSKANFLNETDNYNKNNGPVVKNIGYVNNDSSSTMEETQRTYNQDQEDNDESFMNVFNSALNHLNKLNLTEENGYQKQQTNGNSYYMLDSAFLPKLQYVSMYLDEVGDKNLSLEVNALAMKYLKDDHLTKVAKNITQAAKRGVQRKFTSGASAYLDVDVDCENEGTTMCDANNLSMASKQYLEKYGISYPQKKNNNNNNNPKPTFDRSLSTPVGNTNTNRNCNVYPHLLINNTANNINKPHQQQLYNKNNDSNRGGGGGGEEDEEIWLFGNPHSKTTDTYMNETNNNNGCQIETQRQQQQNNNENNNRHQFAQRKSVEKGGYDSYKVFDNEDDTSHILDVERLKRLPKLL